MKRKHILFSLLISILILSSCREITIKTIVNKDGSFTRLVTVIGDSSEVFKPDLPYPVNASWEMEFRKDSLDDEEYILTYSKTFQNIDLLNLELKQDTGWRKNLSRDIRVEKQFGFFYSYLTYTEVIQAANLFTLLDYKEYMSAEDQLWITGKKLALNASDSTQLDEAEELAEEFLQEAVVEEIMQAFKINVEELDDPNIPFTIFDSYRDSIAKMVSKMEYDSSLELIDSISMWSQNPDILKLKDVNPELFTTIDSKLDLMLNVFLMESYQLCIEMPGIITETNSQSTRGNLVKWNISPNSILFEDLTMHVESRTINRWMFIIAGLILLSFIILMVVYARKKTT